MTNICFDFWPTKVPPKWLIEPTDTEVLMMSLVQIPCAAEGMYVVNQKNNLYKLSH